MPSTSLREFAPAKVNLTLRVLARRDDGFHELESLVAFADVGDDVSLSPGTDVSLTLEGHAAALEADLNDNLVMKAWFALRQRVDGLSGGRFTLVKRLPIAAGLGGGSSDAAAALRLLARHNNLALDDPRLAEAASVIGSDVPVCLAAKSCTMRGRGELLSDPIALPQLNAVLVNPRLSVPTPEVFRALGLGVGEAFSKPEIASASVRTYAEVMRMLTSSDNDLEPPAIKIQPAIAKVKAALEATEGADLIRMSGSGASVFATYATAEQAGGAAHRISRDHADWWSVATRLG